MTTTTKLKGARTSGVTKLNPWPLSDGAFRLDITVESYMGTLVS